MANDSLNVKRLTAERLYWAIIPLHFFSFFGANSSGKVDAFDVCVLSAGTLMVLVWAEAILKYLTRLSSETEIDFLSLVWIMSSALLVAINLFFWILGGFKDWPNGAYLATESIGMAGELPIFLLYLALPLASAFCLGVVFCTSPNTTKTISSMLLSLSISALLIIALMLANYWVLKQ